MIDSLTPYEGEVHTQAGHWYALRIRPYITLDNKIDGASIVLLDIDALKRGAEKRQAEGKSGGDGEQAG